MNVSQPSHVLTARAAAAGAFDSLFLGLGVADRRVRGERGVLFCGARGHTTAAAFDRTLRGARHSPTEALRTA